MQCLHPWFDLRKACLALDKFYGFSANTFRSKSRIAAAEFANGEAKLNLPTSAGHIAQRSGVVTMDRGGDFKTQWTTRGGRGGTNLDQQTLFRDLDLIEPHPFWQIEQDAPFHHDLTSAKKTNCERPF
jgi:hypothetical protein